jgi:hypothetical protein
MQLDELIRIIRASGGQCHVLGYANALLEKINRVEATGKFKSLIAQLQSARESGDFRGRLLNRSIG